jgi:hypothetical protein
MKCITAPQNTSHPRTLRTHHLSTSNTPHTLTPPPHTHIHTHTHTTHPTHTSDDKDGVIVSKRDPESAHPVRVASMDYFVPEKVPQPKNVLESLVWDREKEVDRARERFQVRVVWCEILLVVV